ncbi:MAG: 2TM domain-containing protein [Actinomycetota bacterium]
MSNHAYTSRPGDADPTDDERQQAARLYLRQRDAFRIHATVFAATMVVIFVVNLATNAAAGLLGDWSAWWSAWALIGWGLGVGVHGLVVRLARPTRRDAISEQRRIDEVLGR